MIDPSSLKLRRGRRGKRGKKLCFGRAEGRLLGHERGRKKEGFRLLRDGIMNKKGRESLAGCVIIFTMLILGLPLTEDLNLIYQFGIFLPIWLLLFWTYKVIDNLISKKISKPKDDQKQ